MVTELDSAVAEEDVKMAAPPLLALPTADKIHRSPKNAAVSPPPITPWSMVSIRNHHDNSSSSSSSNDDNNNPPIIFPPINHENLEIHNASIAAPIYNNQENSDSDSDSYSDTNTNSNSSSSFSMSEANSPQFSDPKSKPASDTSMWFGSWAEILHSKVNGVLRYIWTSFASSRSVVLTVVLIVFLYLRQRRRLRVGEERRVWLIGTIREKDEKIKQLLEQISGMNQVLLKLHRAPTSPST